MHYDSIETLPVEQAQATVIWLHGLGASGDDFRDVIHHLDMPENVRFILPHAPVQPVTINGGLNMPAWFDIMGLDRESQQDEAGIVEASERLHAMIEHEISHGIAADRIVLMGFSQGGALALYTACTTHLPLAGVIGLSTYLPLRQQVISQAPEEPYVPVAIAHGSEDDIVPLHYGQMSVEVLESAGFSVDSQVFACGHELCWAEIQQISAWLQRMLA